MRILLFAILQGCSVVVPISQFDPGVAELCQEGRQAYQNRSFEVVMFDDPDELSWQCGPHASACTDGFTIWVPNDATCPARMAHELNHVFGNHFE